MSKHTPGPWVANVVNAWPEQIGCCPLIGKPYSIAHGVNNVAAASTPEDASLIAAAPDLLEALKTLPQSLASTDEDLSRWLEKAKAAIDKAEGRA